MKTVSQNPFSGKTYLYTIAVQELWNSTHYAEMKRELLERKREREANLAGGDAYVPPEDKARGSIQLKYIFAKKFP